MTALADMKSGKYGDRTYTRPVCRVPGPGSRRSEVLRAGRARFVRVRTEVYTGERGPRPGGMGAGSPMRGRTSGDRPAGLRREDPDASRPGYPGSPTGRIAGDLHHVLGAGHGYSVSLPWTDRPVRSEERSSLYRTGRFACSQPSIPGSRPESSPRPTRRTAAHGTLGNVFDERG